MKFKTRPPRRRKSRPELWVFWAAGFAIVAFGAYMAGGDELTCTSASPSSSGIERGAGDAVVAECTMLTRKWLGQRVVSSASYAGITNVDTLRVGRKNDDRVTYDDFLRLMAGDREAARLFATSNQVRDGNDQLRAWFDSGARGEARVDFSSWPFGRGAMGFGVVWLLLLRVMRRADTS